MSKSSALAGRRALVTGASRGIGQAVARALLASGTHVAGVGRDRERLAVALPAVVAATTRGPEPPGTCVHVIADLAAEDGASRAVEEAESALGPLDVIVHAAGSGGFGRVDELGSGAWEAARRANLDATVALALATLPRMVRRGQGDFVGILSIAAVYAFPGAAAYCAAKAGALMFLRCAREDVRRHGVRVSIILPGSVNTPFWDEHELGFDRTAMLGADDVAQAVLAAITASDRASLDEIRILPRGGIL